MNSRPYRSDLTAFNHALNLLSAQVDRHSDAGAPLTPYRILSRLSSETDPEIKSVLEDEICEIALPTLLDRGQNLLRAARLAHQTTGTECDTALLERKIDLLSRSHYLSSLENLPGGYGFVSYPGYLLVEPRALVERFPGNLRAYFPFAYPVIYELEGDLLGGKPTPGWLAFFFVKPETLPGSVELFRAKVVEAVLALERLNSRIVGLGGLSASYTDGGRYLTSKTRAAITTGHNYTVANMVNTLGEAAAARKMKISDLVVAVVGAAGSVGSGVAATCAAIGVKELILIDRREVQGLADQLSAVSHTPVRKGSFRDDIPKAHAVLVATSSYDNLFLPSDLRYGAIIIDDSQPKNVGERLLRDRPDLLILEGGSVALPPGRGCRIHKAFGPKLKNFDWRHINTPLAGESEVPSCLAEVLLLTLLGEEHTLCSVGRSDPVVASRLNEKAASAGFRPGRLQAFGKLHEDERLIPAGAE